MNEKRRWWSGTASYIGIGSVDQLNSSGNLGFQSGLILTHAHVLCAMASLSFHEYHES